MFVFIAMQVFTAGANSLEVTSSKMFKSVELQLRALRAEQQLTTESVSDLVKTTILPNVDTKYFTYKVLGKHLKTMTSEQKQELIEVLTDNLTGNYVHALKQFDTERFNYGEVRYTKSMKIASTNIIIKRKRSDINIQTKWRYVESEQKWLVYDIVVEGISMLQTKQKELAHLLLTNDVSSVIAKLKLS